MATQKLQIVAFQPDQGATAPLVESLQKFDCELFSVPDPASAAALLEQGNSVDLCIIPLRCSGGQSATSITLQIRSHELLSATPVVCLSPGADKSVVHALYGVGADLVLVPPYDVDLIYFQFEALARQRRMFAEHLRDARAAVGLHATTIGALDAVGAPLAVFRANQELQFANATLCQLIGSHDAAEATRILQPLSGVVEQAVRSDCVLRRMELVRADGRAIPISIRTARILDEQHACVGVALAITDHVELGLLQAQVAHTDRIEGLSLLLAAGWMQVLKNVQVDPFGRLQSVLETTARNCDGAAVLSHLLEFLDQLFPSTLRVTLRTPAAWQIGVSAPDLFQMLGQLTLYTAAQIGYVGELTIAVERADDGNYLKLTWFTSADRPQPLQRDTEIHAALRRLAPEDSAGAQGKSAPASILSAQTLAQRYGSSVQYGWRDDGTLKLRLTLPLPPAQP